MSTEKSAVVTLTFVIDSGDSEPIVRRHRFHLKSYSFDTIKGFKQLCHSFYGNDISDVFYTIHSGLDSHENISLIVDSDVEALMNTPALFQDNTTFTIGLDGPKFKLVSPK